PLAHDDENAVQGGQQGAKVLVETWTRLDDWGFLQAHASWAQPFQDYSGRVRLGYRFNPAWSAGLEGAAFGNVNHDQGRAGAFVRLEWNRGEISVSAGADGDQNSIYGAYGSLNAMFRF
ncbi:MAG: cellulose biosynthesis protein BcsS, partial [Proteobacteria bacterium]|nr:cellulose biosynthesis protein BcsS [Pseudomonadota bacterium]